MNNQKVKRIIDNMVDHDIKLNVTLGLHQLIKIQCTLPKENHHIFFQN